MMYPARYRRFLFQVLRATASSGAAVEACSPCSFGAYAMLNEVSKQRPLSICYGYYGTTCTIAQFVL